MPTGGRPPDLLVDTSVAVALVLEDHEHHVNVVEAVGRRRLGLCGHAAFETYSILTRLPPPARLTPRAAARAIDVDFPATLFLGAAFTAELLASLPRLGIAGGSVYDALVGAAANEHRIALGTRDRRALEVYRALEVEAELIG
jgi:predicted nucleic acid-binding protein